MCWTPLYTPPLLWSPVPGQESERSCVCLFLKLSSYILTLLCKCGIFSFFNVLKHERKHHFSNEWYCRFDLMIYCLKIYVSSLMVIWSHQTLSTMTLMSRQSNCTLELPTLSTLRHNRSFAPPHRGPLTQFVFLLAVVII
jgi:hypothetical protein